jgi:hypothetical protein
VIKIINNSVEKYDQKLVLGSKSPINKEKFVEGLEYFL